MTPIHTQINPSHATPDDLHSATSYLLYLVTQLASIEQCLLLYYQPTWQGFILGLLFNQSLRSPTYLIPVTLTLCWLLPNTASSLSLMATTSCIYHSCQIIAYPKPHLNAPQWLRQFKRRRYTKLALWIMALLPLIWHQGNQAIVLIFISFGLIQLIDHFLALIRPYH